MHSPNITTYGPYRPLALLSLHNFHAFPRARGRTRLSGWLSRNWIRQHNGLFRSIGPGHGHGAHLRPGLWGKTLQTFGPRDAENNSLTPSNFSFHFILVAQHEENITLMRPTRRHRHRSSIFHTLLSARSRGAIIATPFENLPKISIHNPASHIHCISLYSSSYPHQLPPCLCF